MQIVAKAKKERRRVRVAGIGHSPSTIACTDDFMISLRKMNRILEVVYMYKSFTTPTHE